MIRATTKSFSLREVDLTPVHLDKHLLLYTDASMDSQGSGVTCSVFAVVSLENADETVKLSVDTDRAVAAL